MHNIRKPRQNFVLNDNPVSFSRCEFAVVEALQVPRLSLHVPSIEQYFLRLVLRNSFEQFQKGLFGIFQRELSAGIHAKKSRLKMHVLLYAHCLSCHESILSAAAI